MKAKEIFIGSTYLSTKFQVPVICELSDMAQLDNICQGAELDSDIISQVFEPIELKEGDWLKKAGFNNIDYGYHKCIDLDKTLRLIVSDGWFYPQIEEIPEMSSGEMQVVSMVRIKYLHELQNIYPIFAGKELTIK